MSGKDQINYIHLLKLCEELLDIEVFDEYDMDETMFDEKIDIWQSTSLKILLDEIRKVVINSKYGESDD